MKYDDFRRLVAKRCIRAIVDATEGSSSGPELSLGRYGRDGAVLRRTGCEQGQIAVAE